MNRKRDSCLVEGSRFETRVSENRKVRKPMMEKKRRARINQSLNDLKRLLMETDNVKKEGSRPSKLEKADVLELTVNYVQKLHKERLALRNGLGEHGTSFSDTCSSPSGDSFNFKAGFKECARVVREVLRHQQQQTVEENLHKRISWHLENFLANIDPDQIQRKSPSLSLGSDSCSSFEEKDMLVSSPELLPHRSSPVNHALCSSSSASDESQDSCHRRSFSNKTNCFEFTSTPNPSPVNALRTDIASTRWTCGFKSIPHGSPDSMADNWNQRTNRQLTRHRIMPSSMPSESNGKANDANNTDLWTCGFLATSTSPPGSSCSSLASSPTQYHYAPEIIRRQGVSPYDDHISLSLPKPEAEKSMVWRPW
ncbi:Class E basic helix-loop-helix 40-like protein [Daphnia magna]|uniref:Class E basic helix-loop-helix 40-like protein n=1 Tax=Daphnia magna TaxID=35525 RepID=A0A164PY90_9CRUS|nr:Class E basic helix-loop-helix 40-like protein [Daphnia magna]